MYLAPRRRIFVAAPVLLYLDNKYYGGKVSGSSKKSRSSKSS